MANLSELENDQLAQLHQAVAENFDSTLEDLKELVKIPSIAWESHDLSQVRLSAEKVKELAEFSSFESVEILTATYGDDAKEGMPAVVARKIADDGYPTIVLYAHHDVQPTGDLLLWETSPFEATQKGDRLFGRGTADDKAGIMVHLAAFRALKKVLGDSLKVGVTLFIEGEEEAGSPSFTNFLHQYQEKLRGDVIVVADSANWKAGVPALTTSLRGVASGTVSVQTGDHSVHSGMFGGPMLDANTVLVRILASLHDDKGNVNVEGLHIAPQPEVEYDEADFRADSGILEEMSLAGEGSISSRIWSKPAISIIGIDATDVDHSSNTIDVRGRAKLSVRLAPGDNPAEAHEALRRHIEKHTPWGAKAEYKADDSGLPFELEGGNKVADLALSTMSEVWGVDAVSAGMGGSIPFIADLKELFPQAEILITGVEDPDTRAHSANESLYLPDFQKAIESEAVIIFKMNTHKFGI